MTDETRPPERSWSPETGWPNAEQAAPTWAEPPSIETDSVEDEYDAWLEAQDTFIEPPAPSPDAYEPEPVVEAPVVVPDPLEAAATPLEVVEHAREPVEAPRVPEVDEPDQVPALATEPGVDAEKVEAPAVPERRSGPALIAALAALVVVLAALAAFLGVRAVDTRGGGGVEAARRDALAAAREASRLVFSYDYRHLDADFAAGKAVTTGKFASDYAKTTSKLVDDVAARYQAVVVADVSDAGVITASADRVRVLVFVNQRSTSTLAAGEKITQSRVTMTLVHQHGRWLVSEVTAF